MTTNLRLNYRLVLVASAALFVGCYNLDVKNADGGDPQTGMDVGASETARGVDGAAASAQDSSSVDEAAVASIDVSMTPEDGSSGTGGTSTLDASSVGAGGSSTGGTSTVDAPLAGAGGTGGASTSTGGTSTVDAPLAGAGGTGGGPAGTGGTTTLSTGAKCTNDSQCTLGFCVDGVCCDSRCGGQCQSCAETGSVGTCTTVQSGDPRGTRTPCAGTDKCKGQCDVSSATACKMPGNTTVCQAESCSGGQHTPESVCSGSGTCPTQTPSTCSTGSCATDNSGKCLGACTSTSCPTGQYCASAGNCLPKKGNGTGNTCATGAECVSTHCSSVDGICCDSDCTGQCQTCGNSTGTCTRVASGQPVGGRAACAGSTDATCGGRCNNTSDDCYFPPAGTSCLAATCTDSSTHQFAKTCPGSGDACATPNPASEACPYGCSNGACTSGHMIIFNKNDTAATGTMAPQPVASGASVSLTANAYSKGCSSFAGWATSASGPVVYADQAPYTMTGTSDVLLDAKWTAPLPNLTISPSSYAWDGVATTTQFSVTAQGSLGLTYAWKYQIDGDANTHYCSATPHNFAGFDTNTLIVNIQTQSSAHLWCEVTDSCGSTVETAHASYTK